MMHRMLLFILFGMMLGMIHGCAPANLTLFPDAKEPLQEFVLSGTGADKVLLIPVKGTINNTPRESFLRQRPSVLQEIVVQLDKAKKDPAIKAIIFTINSPGGTATASDIIYHEIAQFKKETGKVVTVCMMDLATSGGYYISLPADMIMAHPTTVTGSVGVIFLRPKVQELLGNVGVDVEVSKFGRNKDIGSPFRKTTREEEGILSGLTSSMGERFLGLVKKHRGIQGEALKTVATARIFTADQAKGLGLVDEIGYLGDGFAKTKKLAGIDQQSRVVVYRRSVYSNDTAYNADQLKQMDPALVSLHIPGLDQDLHTGWYYIWPAALGE